MQPSDLSPTGRKFLTKIEFDQNEQILKEVRKHPFGLFVIFITGALVTIGLFTAMLVFAMFTDVSSVTSQAGINGDGLSAMIVLVGCILALGSVVFTGIIAYLYTGNVVIITTDKIAQQLTLSLFNKKISQLSIGDVQDVTVKQQGIFAHIFNYGTFTIETAGELSNYTFTYAPNPTEIVKVLVGSHEKNADSHGN